MSTSDPLGVPEIEDKRTKPAGLLPKNAQAWVMVAIAIIMVLVILFSGRTAPKPIPKEQIPPAPSDLSTTRIDEVRRRIEEQANRLRAEQERVKAAQAGIAAQEAEAPPQPPYSHPTAPTGYGDRGYDYRDMNQRNWSTTDEEKRASLAPFASNIAQTFRSQDQSKDIRSNDALSGAASLEEVAQFTGSRRRPGSAPDSQPADSDREEQVANGKRRKAKPSHDHRPGETDYRLFEGTVLETVLTNRLDGYFSGPANCMVTTDVYTPNGAHLLIPRGSRVLGEVRRVDTFGQQRLAVVFHRIIMPDGYSVLLDQFQGLNQIGETGSRDQVNNHYLQLFGVSLAIGAIAGLAQTNTQYGADVSGTQVYEQGIANSLSQSSLRILDRYLNVLPTFTIREGHRVKIYLTQDLSLPAFDKHPAEAELEAE